MVSALFRNFAVMNRQEKTIIALLAALNFTHILDFMIMMPLGNKLMPHFGISPQQFSVAVSAYGVSAFVSGIAGSFFVDRFDRKKVLLFGYAGFIIGTFCCGIAWSYPLLLAARIVAGLFGGLISAQVLSIVADTFSYERRGRAMGTIFAAFSIASILGVPGSLMLADAFDWHTPFFAIAGMGVLVFVLVMRYLPVMTKHLHPGAAKPATLEVFREIFKSPMQRLALLFNGMLILGHFLIIPFMNPYMQHNVGFTELQRSLIYMVGGVCSFFAAPLAGKLADKRGKYPVFVVCALASLLPVFLITNMPQVKYYYVLMVTGFWFMMSTGRGIPVQAMVSNVVNPEHRGSFMSINSSMQQLFMGIASLMAGWILVEQPDKKILHYQTVGYLSIGIILLCIFIGYRLHFRMKQKAAATSSV
jgi:MFS transporter, DHA1 family, inner membrane transport protein